MAQITVSPNSNAIAGAMTSADQVLNVRQLSKTFGARSSVTNALKAVSFDVSEGEYVSIMGPSGSGKTTLLNCIATIDKPTSGQILIDGQDLTRMSSRQLSKFRREKLGFIFQDFNLLDTLSGFDNIALSLTIKGIAPSEISARIESIAATLGVKDVLDKYPFQMSGGQKQRIAAARAIVSDPTLILADEPTGALDSRNSALLLEAFEVMNSTLGATILMVTHDSFAASFSDRVLFLRDGQVFNEIRKGSDSREAFFSKILDVVSFLGGDSGHVA